MQPQDLGYSQLPRMAIMELPRPITHTAPLHFSKETYEALLQAYNPVPDEVKVPSNRRKYSFVALQRRGSHPIISFNETGGLLSDMTVDPKGTFTALNEHNFCRMPGCGYWEKNPERVSRHRLAHFTDRGYECSNPNRKGTDAPKHSRECQLSPGQYLTRLDQFKKHFESESCRAYSPSPAQMENLWRGPRRVDDIYLLPFTRDVHIPFIFKTPQSWDLLAFVRH